MKTHGSDRFAQSVARRSSRRSLLAGSLGLGVIATSATLSVPMPAAGQGQATPVADAPPLGAHVIAEWSGFYLPEGFAFGFDSVWVPNHRSPNVTTRIDPATNTIIAVIEGTGYHAGMALVVNDRVWVTGGGEPSMVPIDPTTNTVGTPVPGWHTDAVYGFDSIWSTTTTDTIDRIDPATSEIMASIQLSEHATFTDWNNGVLVTASAVWVDHQDLVELIQIDPSTFTIVAKTPYQQLIEQAQAQTTVPAGKGTEFIWRVTAQGVTPQGLLRIDPSTGAGLTFLPLTATQLGDHHLAVNDESVWVGGDGQIARVDVATNRIDATYPTHQGTTGVGLGFGSVWVGYEGLGLVQRLDLVP